jgi:hypothetical protein
MQYAIVAYRSNVSSCLFFLDVWSLQLRREASRAYETLPRLVLFILRSTAGAFYQWPGTTRCFWSRHSTTRRCATRSSSSCTEAASTLLAQAILWKPNVYLGRVGGLAIQYPERERLHSSREAKTGLLFGQIKVPSLPQAEVQLHELQVLLLLRSLPRAAILLLAH